ncbi:hypothetical protein G6O69_22525 [Pseudenhygromyxa sp. WMMC2535]|uniref:PEP/pyruvate-binding domain-containing protein n=1 Tax=Pseudenhygromyxa sp. WMMC2535 TaxID=2712867 RepID=UPI0015549724|nr:PEP/pyruvate-binding domain-containing protein [Pseudenhygromyxa sp. WMMC2535]NVB40631.1 hypothetical protein [Pseudenhygromyxa sp. WMMC2535]
MPSRPRLVPAALSWALSLSAPALLAPGILGCAGSPSAWPEDGKFDDHSVARLRSIEHFETLAARNETGAAVVKFVIVGFGDPHQQIRYLDGRFYEFHDQWYWFRLANGHRVPGARGRPLTDQHFESVAAVTEWSRTKRAPLPLGLRTVDERLYSDYFYEIAVHREQRVLGIGTLIHLPARSHPQPREALWAFELEYADEVDSGALERFFSALGESLPPAIAEDLRFIARSPAQEQLVNRLRARDKPLADKLLTYAELAVPGEIQVYNPGLIAGRLRKLPADPQQAAALLASGDEGAIWMLARVPDELPTGAGLLTGVPQTPLAHVNLLARDRGIPNVYLGGVMDDPQLDSLARVHAPVVLLAEPGGVLRIEPISEGAYARWRGLRASARAPTLTAVDPAAWPYTLDLDTVDLAEVPALRPAIGGKSAGFPFLRAAKVERPERPLAITVRAYAEHLAALRPLIAAALDEPSFDRDGRLRYLLLEGREDFEQRFSSAADRRWLADFDAAHEDASDKDPIAALLARGGVKRAIRDAPLDPAAAAAITDALTQHFGHFAANQGLRFRSSSTVEDVEGFSGAGLYDSNTGFLHPEAQASKKDRKRSVAWALRKTWASYWSFEAFEERRTAGVDHLAGNMAVLVHARFDDALERSNGVITLTLDLGEDRRGALQRPAPAIADMEVDVQLGALSVTNPPPERAGEVLPEVSRVTRDAQGRVAINRLAASTELPAGAQILDDVALIELLDATTAVAERWLAAENRELDHPRARGSVTLDLEFRALAPGWPAYASGEQAPSRVVIKQVRSLDPGLPAGSERLLDQPLPRDLLAHADRVEQRKCQSGRAFVQVVELFTDPMAAHDLGHAKEPFLARIGVRAEGLPGGSRHFDLDHQEFIAVSHGRLDQGMPWSLRVDLEPTVVPAVGIGVDRIELEAGLLRLFLDGHLILEEPAPCTLELMLSTPQVYLRSLLPAQ